MSAFGAYPNVDTASYSTVALFAIVMFTGRCLKKLLKVQVILTRSHILKKIVVYFFAIRPIGGTFFIVRKKERKKDSISTHIVADLGKRCVFLHPCR